MILEKETFDKFGFNCNVRKGNTLKNIIVKCDFCGVVFERQLYYVIRDRKTLEIDVCSNKNCRNKKNEQTNLKKFGETSPNKLKSVKEKREQTNLKNLGVKNPGQSKDVKEKMKQTNLKKRGVEYASQDKQVIQKQENTMLERHGVKRMFQKTEVLNKAMEKLKLQETIDKRNDTMLNSYGHENAAQVQEFQQKKQETNLERFGVEHYFQSEEFFEKNKDKNKLSLEDIKEHCKKKNYIPLFKEEEYVSNRDILKFKCIKHDFEFESCVFYISANNFNQCPKCRNYTTSIEEKQVVDYVKSIYSGVVVENTRSVIHPHELDIYLPEKNIAIEYNGLYWHSSIHKDKQYHRNKFISCKEKGIKLIQIFEDEWRDSQEVCKSVIQNKLGLCVDNLNARDLDLFVYSPAESSKEDIEKVNNFIDQNHLQGKTRFNVAFCLVDKNNEIFYCLSLRNPFTENKQDTIEIARACSKNYHNIRGAFSKALKYAKEWAKNQRYRYILTYSDCRYSEGNSYKTNEFQFVIHNPPNYFYFSPGNGFKRESRFKWRAQKELSEKQLTEQNNMISIYDAGHMKWLLELN